MSFKRYAKENWSALVFMVLSVTAGPGLIYLMADPFPAFRVHLVGFYILALLCWILGYLLYRKGAGT